MSIIYLDLDSSVGIVQCCFMDLFMSHLSEDIYAIHWQTNITIWQSMKALTVVQLLTKDTAFALL